MNDELKNSMELIQRLQLCCEQQRAELAQQYADLQQQIARPDVVLHWLGRVSMMPVLLAGWGLLPRRRVWTKFSRGVMLFQAVRRALGR